MLEKLESIVNRFEEVKQMIIDPEIISDQKRYMQLNKEYKELESLVAKINAYKDVLGNIENNKAILEEETDPEFREMAKEELDELLPEQGKLEEELKFMLIPKDPDDSKNCILEIRAGTGGDEAALFVGDLLKMYEKYASNNKWKLSINSLADGTAGGFKEVTATMTGNDVYGTMKFESGVHRVQRVPATETQGRIHTSAVTVAVMPEVEDIDFEINSADLRIDVFRASGAGGQHVNKTESAVRITHIPTGVVVSNQDQKSQLKNKEKAMKVLRSRLYDAEMSKRKSEEAALRKSLVSTGDRSAKIRTYNYPQGRVTDHRINLTLYNLQGILGGDLTEISEKLRVAENMEKLKEGGMV
jgi:peptide chain release factor 1